LITTIIAVWGAVVASLGLALHAPRFLWDRPRLALKATTGFWLIKPGSLPPLGLPSDKFVLIEATKRGRGAITVTSAGFRLSDGSARSLITSDRTLPARLEESDKVTFFGNFDWVCEAVQEDKQRGARIKYVICGTTEGERRARISSGLRKGLEKRVISYVSE